MLLQNSFGLSAAVTLAALLLGLVIAIALISVESGLRRVGTIGLLIALALPPFLIANAWLRLFGYNGSLRPWFDASILSFPGTVAVMTVMFTPIAALLWLSACRTIDQRLVESEPRLAGGKLIRTLILPVGKEQAFAAAIIIFVVAFNHFTIPALFQTKVYPVELWIDFNTTFNYQRALWNALPILTVPLIGLLLLRARTVRWPAAQTALEPRLIRQRIGVPIFIFSAAVTVVYLLLATLPLWNLLLAAGTWSELGRTLSANQREIFNSAALAAGAATLCCGVGWLTANSKAGGAFWLLFFTPGVLMGIALIWAFNRPGWSGFYQSIMIALFALVLRYAAVGWEGARRALSQTDKNLAESAKLMGASRWQLMQHAIWPQLRGKIGALWLIIYLLALWDVEAFAMFVPPGGETLSWRAFNLLHYGHTAQVNALCLLVVTLGVLPLIAWGFIRSFSRKTGAWTAVACALAISGCSDTPEGHSHIDSQIFESVQVIGSRGAGAGEFNKPRSLAVDREDNLYVADITGRIQKFSPTGQYLLAWQMPQTDIGKPKGMDRDSDGNIIVIEPHYSRVNHFAPDGKLIHQWGSHGTNAGQLYFPRAVAVTAAGDLWVSEYGATERVQLFTDRGSNYTASFGSRGSAPGEFDRPEGIGLNPRGELLVADSCNHRIQVFGTNGAFARQFGKPGVGSGELSYPGDVRCDSQGRVYVAEFGNGRIQIFDGDGLPLEIIGTQGQEPGQFHNPWSIAFDSRGNLYVADAGNHRVQKLIRRNQLASARQVSREDR